ncbi:MAG: NrpR regulatory domain-containing protein [Dehalococcoidales bacterium]|nr:NrpR regulatory domain-containing protein [Dehalococcoidales bacterium]
MDHPVGADAENKLIAILKILSESSEPLGSITLARRLEHDGVFLRERAVRYHLKTADERGFTRPGGRDGRMITPEGRREVKEALASQQLGFVRDKLELLAYLTTFDPIQRSGQLAINTSVFDKARFQKALAAMKPAFRAGICVSELVAVAEEGEKLGSAVIPEGKIGFATVCGASINGVLLKAGVPTEFRFGGVLEIRNKVARRFVAITEYAGTSSDPSEQFIQAGMTSVAEAVKTGSGKILGAFRTIPAPAREVVEDILGQLKKAGIGGIYALGNTSEPLCQIPVSLNRFGVVQLGGLNPVAAAVEAGIEVENAAESGMIDFRQLVNYKEL